MKKKISKSIVALMVAAIACVFTSCKDGSLLGLGLVEEPKNPTISYSLLLSKHVTLEGVTVVNDSLRITCGHEAIFPAKHAEDTTKTYKVYNAAKLGNTDVIVENFSDIEGRSFNWSNGRFILGKSVITLVFGETYATSVKVGTKTYTIPELSYCTVKAVVLNVKDIVKGIANATLLFTLSCDDEVEYNLTFRVAESHKEVLSYTYDDATVTGKGTGNVVRHNFVDGVEAGTDTIPVTFDCNLQAEGEKNTADLTAIAFQSVATTATTGVYRASWNVVSHELYATYPATVTFIDNNEEHTVALKAVWNVKFDSKETNDNSDNENYVYNTTAKFNLVAGTIVMASATQKIEQKDAKNSQKITATVVGEDKNGVKIRLFIDNTKEADVEKFFNAPSGLSVKTEAEKRRETSPIALNQTGHNVGNWNKGAQQTTADNNVKYNTYSRVDSYVYNNGKVSTSVTYTKNDNYIVVWEGKEYKVENLGDAAITAGTPKETADNSNNSVISKTFTVNHSIARGNASANADQVITLWKNRTQNTIAGYYVKAAAMTDIYNANRTAPARTVICALFEEINGSNTLYVEFNTNGQEISRHANVTVSNDGIMSMVWNGSAFVPGKLTGVTSTSATPQEWLYTGYADSNVQGYVSPMSVTKHSLKNPYKESGVKTTVDGEEIITINGITLK